MREEDEDVEAMGPCRWHGYVDAVVRTGSQQRRPRLACTVFPVSDFIRMVLVPALLAQEHSLAAPLGWIGMSAARAGLAGLVWRHRHQPATGPSQLVVELAPEFAPALVEN